MNRSTLIEQIATRFSHLSKSDAETAVRTILDAMTDAMVREQRIEIMGFGNFTVVHRAPRIGRNPRSGEPVEIPQKRLIHFKPGKALRESVNTQG